MLSSGMVMLWDFPSSVTGMGVIWLLTTIPVDGSTNCANTRVGRVPGATVPEYVRESVGGPSSTATRAVGTVMFRAFVAGPGVTGRATESTMLAAFALAATTGGPDPPPACRTSVPEPLATTAAPAGSG